MLTKKIIAILSYMLVYCASILQAQDSLLLRNYQFVSQGDPWLTHANAAALTRFFSNAIVEAELSAEKGNGGLVDYADSPGTLSATAYMESFYRLSQRAVAYGAISYEGWNGRDITGSAFMQRRMPFNLVEDSLTNAGRKHRDTYHLVGGLGVDVWHGMSLGVRIDYTAANYAKYKDLRHQNKLMDMQLTLGAYVPLMDWLSVGANYTYHRQTESITFGTYGKSERVYKTLIDYGAFMGRVEQFGNEGFTDKAREMPLFEESHGAALQAEAIPTDGLSVFGSIAFSSGNGYYGRKSPYTATYTRHQRDISEGRLVITYQPMSRMSRFCLDVSLQKEKLNNSAETFRELTNATGAYYYEYYDAVETGTKKWHDWTVGLTAQWGIRGELPAWELSVRYLWKQRRQTAYLYPYYRYQLLTSNGLMLNAKRRLLCRKGVWTIALKASWQNGFGAPFHDGTFVDLGINQEKPSTMDAFLYREYRYLTAPRYSAGGSLQYAFVFPKTRLKTYVRMGIDCQTTSEENIFTQGNDHSQVAFAIGCTY